MVHWLASIHILYAECSLLGCGVQHDSRPEWTGVVLQVLGKGHNGGCYQGYFTMPTCQGSDKMASMTAPNEPFYACMAHKGVGAATQMTGLLQGVTNGALDIQYTYTVTPKTGSHLAVFSLRGQLWLR